MSGPLSHYHQLIHFIHTTSTPLSIPTTNSIPTALPFRARRFTIALVVLAPEGPPIPDHPDRV